MLGARAWWVHFGLLFLVALGSVGCGNEQGSENPPEPPGTGSAVLAERAKVLDAEGLRALSSVSPAGELVFASTSPVLRELVAGDVLIVGPSKLTPHGALAAIEAVTPQAAGLILQIRPASIGEAFDRLQISLATSLTGSDVDPGMSSPSSWNESEIRQPLGLTHPVHLSKGSGANRMELVGSLSVDSDLEFKLDFDFAELALKELTLSFGAKETFAAELFGQGQLGFDQSVTLGSFWFTPITLILPIPVPPGAVPVVITPRLALRAGVQGSIQGDVTSSVTQMAGFTAGLGFKDGEFKGFSEDESTFDFEPPTYQASASVKAFAGARLDVLIYAAVGPYAGVEAFVEAAASLEGPPPCVTGSLEAGLSAKVGVDFLASYETVLFEPRYPLASFDTCSPDPNAPAPAITWSRSYGRSGSPGEQATAVTQAADGTYFVVGNSALYDGVTGFGASIWSMRLDPLGNVIWQRAFRGLAQIGIARAAAEVPAGFVVAGSRGVMKLDSGGNLVWARSYEAAAPLEIGSIATHPDGSSVVAGSYGTQAVGWAMKLDPSGAPLWSRSYGGTALARVRITSDGGTILVGTSDANLGDILLVKLDPNGAVIWKRLLDNRFDGSGGESNLPPTSSGDRGFDAVEKPDGGYVVVGESYGSFPIPEPNPAGYYATWIVELDAQGQLSGAGSSVHRAPPEAAYGGAYAVGMRPNGSALVVGRRATTSSELLQSEDVLVIQGATYSALGGAGQDAVSGGDTLGGFSRGAPLFMTADGGAILAATSDSFAGQDQFWLVKLNRTGGINFPYRVNLSGTSYVNEHAVSSPLSADSMEVPVAMVTFTLDAESTEAVGLHLTW